MLVVQQDEFNAPVRQEQVFLEGQVQMEEQKLEPGRSSYKIYAYVDPC